jgi:hypothetical protein
MMMQVAPGASCLVDPATRHVVYCVAPPGWVVASANSGHEWSVVRRSTIAWYYSNVSACIASDNGVTCPHDL